MGLPLELRKPYDKVALSPRKGRRGMALYKHKEFIDPSNDAAFDTLLEPGTAARWPGIYRCHACGHEIAIAGGHILPSQNHHQHALGIGPIQWRLVVSHKKY